MLSLCLIVKNEEKNLPTLFDSIIEHVDQVVVTDTGSTDKTKEVCEKYCGDKLKWSTFEWCDDFAAARQFNLEQADGEWFIWADADDEIQGGENLKGIIKKCEEDKINAVVYPYHYMVDEHGNTTALQHRERLVKNDNTYKWVGRLHESLCPILKTARAIKLSDSRWLHRTNDERVDSSIKRNVRVLEKALESEIKDDKIDARTVFNLGNAYYSDGQYDKALSCYKRYIPMSGWAEEIYLAQHRTCLALGFLAEQYPDQRSDYYEQSIEMGLLAIKEKPKYPDAYIDIGKAYYELGEYENALHWFGEAARKDYPDTLPVVNPLDYTAHLNWLTGHCYIQLHKFKEARPFFAKYSEAIPGKDADKIINEIDEAIRKTEDVAAIAQVGELFNTDDFWKLIPEEYLDFPEILTVKNQIVKKPDSTGKDLAIYCSKGVVKWDPSCEQDGGIGGSEEAVINISRLLAKKGWNVSVYGVPKKAGTYDGVQYKHYTEFNPRDKWDVFISWRMPTVFVAEINATRKYVWLHDTTPEEQFTAEILANIDKIIVLSDYHRSLYPGLPDDMFIMSGNGINPDHFKEEVKRDPNYCIYASAPNRGLECLLKMWPQIREKNPKAELHWFYGWETFDAMHKIHNPEVGKKFKAELKELLKQPGVTEEGRVDHETLAKKFQEANLWLYPTEFEEIYCITADKAQAGGAVPITTDTAALDERVKFGVKFNEKNIYDNKEAQGKFIEAVTENLKKDHDRKKMVKHGLSCTWERIAKQWSETL